MRCGTLGFSEVHPYSPTQSETYGANRAELGLATATLASSASLAWDFWGSNIKPSLTSTSQQRVAYPLVDSLKAKFRERFSVRPIEDLQHLRYDLDYMFIASLGNFAQMSELRREISAPQIPICTLSHSIYMQDMMPTYAWHLIAMAPHDLIASSSVAGVVALRNLFSSAIVRLAEFSGKSTSSFAQPNIVHIPFGVDVDSVEILTQVQARIALRLPIDAFVVLYMGRISEEFKSDLDPLIECMRQLRVKKTNPYLLLAGSSSDPVYSQYLDRRIYSSGLSDVTVRLNNCPEFLKPSLYAAASVMVSLADSIQETFGITILEAMAHSCPVITSKWSGCSELVINGITGFLVKTFSSKEVMERASILSTLAPSPVAAHYLAQRTVTDVAELQERLLLLASNSCLCREMGAAARLHTQANYAWPKIASQFISLWNHQLAESRPCGDKRSPAVIEAFAHYGDSMISPEDLLARVPEAEEPDFSSFGNAPFNDQNAFYQIRALLELTSSDPISIIELRERGFDLDCILWLAKKGLRRIGNNSD